MCFNSLDKQFRQVKSSNELRHARKMEESGLQSTTPRHPDYNRAESNPQSKSANKLHLPPGRPPSFDKLIGTEKLMPPRHRSTTLQHIQFLRIFNRVLRNAHVNSRGSPPYNHENIYQSFHPTLNE